MYEINFFLLFLFTLNLRNLFPFRLDEFLISVSSPLRFKFIRFYLFIFWIIFFFFFKWVLLKITIFFLKDFWKVAETNFKNFFTEKWFAWIWIFLFRFLARVYLNSNFSNSIHFHVILSRVAFLLIYSKICRPPPPPMVLICLLLVRILSFDKIFLRSRFFTWKTYNFLISESESNQALLLMTFKVAERFCTNSPSSALTFLVI